MECRSVVGAEVATEVCNRVVGIVGDSCWFVVGVDVAFSGRSRIVAAEEGAAASRVVGGFASSRSVDSASQVVGLLRLDCSIHVRPWRAKMMLYVALRFNVESI